jgi:hypothetical protein
MRNKLNLKEGEVQRILGLHKKAIIKEHKMNSLNEELLMEKTYDITLMRKGGNNFWLKDKDKITKFKVTSFNKDMVAAKVTIKDGNRDENDISIQFDCKTPDVIEFTGDWQIKGSKYRTDKKLKNLIKWYCAGKPNKDADQGSSSFDKEKRQGYAYTKIKPFTNKGGVRFKGGNLYFSCKPYTQESHFKLDNVFWKNKVLQNTLIKNFCKYKKTSYVQMKDQPLTITDMSNKYFFKEINSSKDSVWKWVGKKEINTPDPNSGKNEEGKDGLVANGTSGTRYSFDFETIMKAIDDTGKCPRSGSSSLSGTSGTSETQGTNGTAGIETPLPVSNKLSSELYYKMIGS